MKMTTSILLILTGIVAGVTFVVSCSDDSPGTADAATCDCPAAEPPLAGRIVVVEATRTLAASEVASLQAVCPTGAQLLSGSCTHAATAPQSDPDIRLKESGFYPNSPNFWSCTYQNSATQTREFRVQAICLKPTP